MKKNLIFISLFLTTSLTYSQAKKEILFAETTKAIATSISFADTTGLKKYIDPSTGLYVLYRIGLNDEYFRLKNISFDPNAFPPMPPFGKLNNTPIKYEALPSYSCDSLIWSKQGCYVDTLGKDRTLSELLNTTEATGQVKTPSYTITVFENIEKNGRRVIITSSEGDGLIMHLLYKNKQWYLVVIDLLMTNCGV